LAEIFIAQVRKNRMALMKRGGLGCSLTLSIALTLVLSIVPNCTAKCDDCWTTGAHNILTVVKFLEAPLRAKNQSWADPLPDPKYADGKSCMNGSPAPPDGDEQKMGHDGWQEEMNKMGKKYLGMRCKSGKCTFHANKYPSGTPTMSNFAYICSSQSIQPMSILILALVGISVLRMLP
jgi:hypothetical protein